MLVPNFLPLPTSSVFPAPAGSPVGLVIASLMCGGDGLADIVGRRFGRGNPLPWNAQKSWAGSAAMFAGEAVQNARRSLLGMTAVKR
jgi:dolichol kinase